jgi:anti-sigma factor RsiW
MNRCPDHSEWVLWAADETTPERRRELEAHRAACDDCRRQSAAVARGLGALAFLESGATPSPDAMRALRGKLHAVAAKRAATPRVILFLNRHHWAASAAAVFVLAIGVWTFMPHTAVPPSILIIHHNLPRTDVQLQDELARISADLELMEAADLVVTNDLGPARPTVAPAKPATMPDSELDDMDTIQA